MHQILKGLEMSLPTNILEQLPTLWVTVECWDNSEGVGVNAKRRDGGRGGGESVKTVLQLSLVKQSLSGRKEGIF